MTESKKGPFECTGIPGKGLAKYDLTRDGAPFASVTILEFLNIRTNPEERKELHLVKFQWPDPPLPKGKDDTVGIQRAQRYELEVSENHVKFLMRYFPSVLLLALNHPHVTSGVQQTKWAVESPRFDHNRLRISRDTGGVGTLRGVMRYPFADIVSVDADGKKIIEKAMPTVLGIMHNLDETIYKRWLERNREIPGREGSSFASVLDRIEVYDVIAERLFRKKPEGATRPATAAAALKPNVPRRA